MAMKAKRGKAAKKSGAKPKKLETTKAAKSAKSKAAPKRKTAAGRKALKTAAPRKSLKTAAKAKPAPKRKAAKPRATPKTARPAPAARAGGPAGPRFEEGRAFSIAGLGGRFSPGNATEMGALWQQFAPRWFGRVPGQVGGKAYGICTNFDEQGNLDYIAAVEIDAPDEVPAELTRMSIPARRYAVFPHGEHISEIGKTWMDIFQKWLPASGRKVAQAPSFELYSESFDPDLGVGGVEIWVPLED